MELSCGHEPTLDSGIGTGYATWAATGETLCYPCTNARERQLIADGATYFHGYVMGAALGMPGIGPAHGTGKGKCPGTVTTWTGGTLAVIHDVSRERKRYSVHGLPLHLTTVYATTPDGREWWGRLQADNGQAVTMRACKGSR